MRRTPFFILVFLICSFFNLAAQSVEQLPIDPRIKTGKLANGLTYYIVSNDVRAGCADFYLVQKVGFSLENNDQKGMTAFLCNIGLRGTRNFPGTTITNYLESLGMNLKKDLKISIGPDESIFRITNVPISRSKAAFDSTLLILYNWSCAINIDEEDLEKEKVYFQNSYVSQMDSKRRSDEFFKQKFFSETAYCPLSPFSVLDQVKSYSTKDLRNYYYKWFRPDLQAVIIVGDVDVAAVEKQINTLFLASPKVLNPTPRRYVPRMEDRGVSVATYSEKEIETAIVSLYLKGDIVPPTLRSSAVPFVEGYMNFVLRYLVEDRVKTRLFNENFPNLKCATAFEHFFQNHFTESLKIEIETSPDSIERALSFMVEELKNIRDKGFSKEEFSYASGRFHRDIQYLYDWRGFVSSDVFARRCIDNYLFGFSLASIELYKEYMDKVFTNVSLEHINTYAKSFIRFDYSSVTSSFPKREEFSLKPDTLIDIVQNADYSLPKTVAKKSKDLKLSPAIAAPGSIISTTKEPISQSTLYTLSNGATLVVKATQTEPQTVYFKTVSKGGLSLMSNLSLPEMKYVNQVAAISKIGECNWFEIEQCCNNLGIELSKDITLSLNQIDGKSGSNDLEQLMEMVYYHFTGMSKDSLAFEKFKKEEGIRNEFLSNSPEYRFADSLIKSRYRFHENEELSNNGVIEALNYDKILTFLKERFSNAANYIFIIVGDVDEEKVKEFACKYIASLPGNSNRRETWRILPYYLNKSNKITHFEAPMDYHRCFYKYSISGASQYNVEDVVISEFIYRIIDEKMTKKLNDMGVPIVTDYSLKKYPEEFMVMDITYMTREYSNMFQAQITQELRRISKDGVDETLINSLRSTLSSKFLFSEKGNNSFWIDIITNRFIYGKDFYTKYLQLVNTIPASKINERLKLFIDNSSRIDLSMSPENEYN